MAPIHDRIRAARKVANLSVNEFAKRVGVSSTAAWNWDWENTTPKADKLPKIAQVLGITVNDLTGANTSGAVPVAANADGETLDTVLADASCRIARLLGIKSDRVAVSFNLK